MTAQPTPPRRDASPIGAAPHTTPDPARALRDVLGQFATGVTIVTTRTATGPVALIANSFASVSLSPPLILWCPAKSSRRFAAFAGADHFVVHILSADQAHFLPRFARAETGFDLDGVLDNPEMVPILPGCLAHIECRTEARHDGGDHLILIGRVLRATKRQGTPLIFSAGKYGRFLAED